MSEYENDTVYFCKTQKDAEKLFLYLDKKGYTWAGGKKQTWRLRLQGL